MPTIEITYGEIYVMCQRSLAGFLTVPLPASQGIFAAKLGKRLNEEFKVFDEQRVKLVKKYQEKLDDGNMGIPRDKTADFQKEFKEMSDQVTEIKTPKIRIEGTVVVPPLVLMDFERFLNIDIAPEVAGA